MDARRTNWFVRTLLIAFVLFLLAVIATGFIWGNPAFKLTPEYIALFILIAVLVLSESFDHLSMGKLLSLTREITRKKEEVQEIKRENSELRDYLIKMTTLINQNQQQSNTTINGVTPELLQAIGVIKAKDKAEEETDSGTPTAIETGASPDLPGKSNEADPKQPTYYKRDFSKFSVKESIDKYLEKHHIAESDIIREAQFAPAFQGLDPIMERKVIFDAYLKTEYREFFFEVLSTISAATLDRLYVQLSKILFYSQAKHVKGQMILLISEFPEGTDQAYARSPYRPERIIEAFQPAISNDLLRIEMIPFREEDIERWKKELGKTG